MNAKIPNSTSLPGHQSNITHLYFSPSGKLFLSGDVKGKLQCWNLPDPVNLKTLEHNAIIRQISFNHDETLLASGDEKGHLHCWDLKSFSTTELTGHQQGRITALRFTPDGHLLSGDKNGVVMYYDVTLPQCPGKQIAQERGGILALWSKENHPETVMIMSSNGINQLDVSKISKEIKVMEI